MEVSTMALTIVFEDDDYIRPFYYNGKRTKYTISKDGSVVNTKTGKPMKPGKVYNTDYLSIRLQDADAGLHKKYLVHRLVAEVFIPNPENLPEVNHINLDKKCNKVSNLEWIDKRGNSLHAINNNVGPFQRGEANRTSKYTDEQVERVCEMLSKGISPKEINIATGVSKAMISMIKIGKVRTHQSDKYSIKSVRKKDMYGDNHPNNIITSDVAKTICEYLQNGYKAKDISKLLGIKKYIIDNIKYRSAWTSISCNYIW